MNLGSHTYLCLSQGNIIKTRPEWTSPFELIVQRQHYPEDPAYLAKVWHEVRFCQGQGRSFYGCAADTDKNHYMHQNHVSCW